MVKFMLMTTGFWTNALPELLNWGQRIEDNKPAARADWLTTASDKSDWTNDMQISTDYGMTQAEAVMGF